MIRSRSRRRAITLVEMMVAMALSVGIMLILTESFKMALDFVRGANSTGEMIYQLNGAGTIISRDLKANHFLPGGNMTGGKLSDVRLDLGAVTPAGGFFRVVAPNPGVEMADAQNFNVNRPATNHQLHFTTILPGGTEQNSFMIGSGGSMYGSPAAEIAYFLVPTGATTPNTGDPKRQVLHNLVRRQRVVAYSSDNLTSLGINAAITAVPNSAEVLSTFGGNVSTLADFADPAKIAAVRLTPLAQLGTGSARYGEDIVLSNVISFEVQADWNGATPPPTFAAGNTDAPYGFLPSAGGIFDTTVNPPPFAARIKSLQITIRVYDPRMKTARQNTWRFGM
jgi:type II secretory pathway pseudopilin PulG